MSNALTFNQFLEQSCVQRNSLLCVGLDPRADTAQQALAECIRIVDATRDVAAVYKPNAAFFEVFGAEGVAALHKLIQHIGNDTPIILDAKRGDIADTSASYAQAAFDVLGAHSITLSPYLGGEGLQPFISRPQFGAFVVCKSSNPGADEFQNVRVSADANELTLHEYVAQRAQLWNVNDNIGLVVGATDPSAVARVRAVAPTMWFLIPGVGAQGGSLGASLRAGLRADGAGLLINASRSIAKANDSRAEAIRLRDEINTLRKSIHKNTNAPTDIEQLATDLTSIGAVKFGEFKTKSGVMSPIYIDLRLLVSAPRVLANVARLYAKRIATLSFDRLAGVPYAALPIATAVSLHMNRAMIYPRKEAKEYGTRAAIEGAYTAGERVIVIDDLITNGESKFEAIDKLTSAGLQVRDVAVLIDRSKNGATVLASRGYALHAVATLPQLLDAWERLGTISPQQKQIVLDFLAA